jgi:hypothetical protein
VQHAGQLVRVALAAAVEGEVVQVHVDELELRLEVVAEADDALAAVLVPCVGDLLELVRDEVATLELGVDEVVESVSEVELELGVEDALLGGVEGDGVL